MKKKLLLLTLSAFAALTITSCGEKEPTITPTTEPTDEPTQQPTVEPTIEPTVEPTIEPTTTPTVEPTVEQTDEPIVQEDNSYILNENYENIISIDNANGTVSNWNDQYSDYDKFNSASDVKYSETYKDNVLQEGDVAINANDDVRHVFYNGVDSARMVSNADGYAFTIPTNTTLVADFSVGKYRSKLYNEDFTLSISSEYSNPYNKWDTYREEWLYRYLDNANYYEQNGLERTWTSKENDTSFLRGYIVDQYDLVINNPVNITKNYYSIASIRKQGDVKNFVLLVLKSTYDMHEQMESIISSYKQIAKQGTPNINYMNNLPVSYNPNWSEETKAYYDLLLTQERTGWGIFTATLPDGRMTVSQLKTSPAYTKQAAISEALDYNFDILPTYQHIAWGRETVNEWPSVAAKNMAGGNGFNGLPVIQMSYQFTDNNNNVSVSQVNDCYTPMFDIYRGYDGDLQNYDLPVNGRYELALRDLAQRIKAYGKPVLFRLNNEMNTDWTSYSGIMTLLDPDIFQATWRITYKIFEEEGVDNCIWIFNPIAKSCPFSSWGEDMSYYPGLEYVQALGLTYYEDNNNNNVNEYTFRKDYTALYDKNNPVWNKYPWIISEFGCGAGGSASGTQFRNQASQVKYVEGMFADFNDRENNPYLQNIKGAVWFSVNDYVGDLVGNQYELVIDELKDTIQALKEGLAPNKLS